MSLCFKLLNAELFDPRRWLYLLKKSDTSTELTLHNKDTFHPFGLRGDKCPGTSLAYMMMRLTLAKLLWHFNFFIVEPMLPWEDKRTEYLPKEDLGLCVLHCAEEKNRRNSSLRYAIQYERGHPMSTMFITASSASHTQCLLF